jgi:hypothetical protein
MTWIAPRPKFPSARQWLRGVIILGLVLGAGLSRAAAQESAHFTYYFNSSDWNNYGYDSVNNVWVVDWGQGYQSVNPQDPTGWPVIGGDDWSYATVQGQQYAYDSYLNAWYEDMGFLSDDSCEGWWPCGNPNLADFLFYYDSDTNTNYRFDALNNAWSYDASGSGQWEALDSAPDDPGAFIGDYNWTYYDDSTYAYDSADNAWYFYYSDLGYWVEGNNPNNATDYIYYTGTDTNYRYDNLSGTWYFDASGNGEWELLNNAPDSPGVLTGGDHWTDHAIDGILYAYDSPSSNWYAYDSSAASWYSSSNPHQGGGGYGILTVGNLLVDYEANVLGGFMVNNDFTLGGTPFDPSGLVVVYDNNGNFAGWQMAYDGLPNGADASFSSLTVSSGMSIGDVYGTVNTAGNLSLGSWSNGSQTLMGLTLGNAELSVPSPTATWHWQQNGVGTAVDQMRFDYGANLSLFANGGSGRRMIGINPGASSVVTQAGSNAPQTYSLIQNSVSASAMSLNLGDSIYLDASAKSLRLGNATVTGNDEVGAFVFTDSLSGSAIAISPANSSVIFSNGFSITGNASTAKVNSGQTALALGGNAMVSGTNAVAISGGNASGNGAIALGANSSASGVGAIAIGANSAASGNGAVALAGGNATANNAIAVGLGTSSPTWGTTVMGHYNVPISGNASSYAPADPAFIVGIGNVTNPANGLVIYNNGDAVGAGNVTLANPAYVSPTSVFQPVELQVNGSVNFNGSATLNGNIILAQPAGNLSMGAFGN